MDGVTEGVTDGVTELVGVIDGVSVLVGVTDGVGDGQEMELNCSQVSQSEYLYTNEYIVPPGPPMLPNSAHTPMSNK